jgi:uncharacterized membrane protein YbhN (UPF0104 family)
LVAVAAELISYVASAELQRHLLAAAGVRIGRLFLVALNYAGSAVSALLPAGAAVSAGYTYRRLVRGGAGSASAMWVLIASGVVSTAALLGLGLAGAELYGTGIFHSPLGFVAAVVLAAVAVGTVVLLAWTSQRPSLMVRITILMGWVGHWGRLLGHRRNLSRPDQTGLLVGTHPVRMSTLRWTGLCVIGAVNWAADGAVLGVSFLALGFGVPWKGLALAYAVSQAASSLPLLGCVGLVEASMTVALVCVGVKADHALAAVLVYRLVGFWSTLPVGWLAWHWLRRQDIAAPDSVLADSEPLSVAAC